MRTKTALLQHPTDHVFLNGQVFDGRRARGVGAVATHDGRIIAVGEARAVRDVAGPGAEEVDLDGGLLLPGFYDAHMHPMVGGLERLRCELYSLGSAQEYLKAIADHDAAYPDAAWFRGGGWTTDAFGPGGPTAELLDRVVVDRPAFVMSSDHHNAWVNTRALETAGIDEHTPDPPDGWLERDVSGRPTGTLREAAMALVQRHVETSREEYAAGLREAQTYLHSTGVTGWHDALIGGYAGLDDPTQAYLDLIAGGELTARVNASQWWDRHRGTEQVDDLVRERERLQALGLDASSVKVMMDGITETFTATVVEPYRGETGCPCGSAGMPFLSHDQASLAVTALDRAGFQVHFHAIGDKAVHDALDALESARRANGLNDLRHQVAHLQLVRPEDRRRFADFAVTANLQGMWVDLQSPSVKLLLPHLDDERAGWHYPFADIAAAGATLAGGSDWPVNPPEPVAVVHALVNRAPLSPDGSASQPLVRGLGLGLEVALAAYTRGSAWVNHHADAGVIQIGARADLVVLDRDPFLGPPEEIGACEIELVVAGGVLVHERAVR